MSAGKVLVYTVSRASRPAEVQRAFDSLLQGQRLSGLKGHDWILWANSKEMLEAGKLLWQNGQLWGTGENKGQHIALGEVLAHARANSYDYIVKVDDDLEWLSKNWLRKLVAVEQALYEFTGSEKHSVLSPRVRGLKNPIPYITSLKVATRMGRVPIHLVNILGGACRLHHVSFFDGYIPDCRRALGAGGDTTIALHAGATKIPMFIVHWLQVRHATAKLEEREPEYHKMHGVYQCVPYIPVWKGTGAEEPSNG